VEKLYSEFLLLPSPPPRTVAAAVAIAAAATPWILLALFLAPNLASSMPLPHVHLQSDHCGRPGNW